MKYLKKFETYKINEAKFDYGCVMLYLDVDEKSWNSVTSIIDKEDITGDGLETDPHSTMLFGIHADVPDTDVEKIISELKPISIKLTNISLFENKDYDVVKFDVESDGMVESNKLFSELPHTNDHPDYHPHTTIAYVKSGNGHKYVRKLKNPIVLKSNRVVYSKTSGEKKEYILR